MEKYVKKVIDLLPDASHYDPTWQNAPKGQQVRDLIDDVTGMPLGNLLEVSGPIIKKLKQKG
jgi:hypothetical protein